MNKNSKLVTGLVVVGGLAAIYFLMVKPKLLMSKDKAIDTIIKKGYYTKGRAGLEELDNGYIMAWAKAAKKDADTFLYQNKTYLTQGGRAQK